MFLLLISLESEEFTATSSNADISKTENFFWILYWFNEIYVKFRVFWKNDQSHSLSITEINNLSYETDLFFQNTSNLTYISLK